MSSAKRDQTRRLRTSDIKRRARQRKKKILALRFSFVILSVVGGFYLFSWLFSQPSVTISVVNVLGNPATLKDDITGVVFSQMEGKYVGVFSKSNAFIFPRRDIKTALLESFPRLEEVSVKLENPNTLVISVKEREPHSMWCGEEVIADEILEDCYFMDENGYIFSQAPGFSGSIFFRAYGAILESNEPVGQQFATPEIYRNAFAFAKSLDELGFEFFITSIKEEDAEIVDVLGTRIIFNKLDDANSLYQNVLAIIENKEFQKERLESGGHIDYLDMRFGNKVFYKFE
jgi:hypothetical protein